MASKVELELIASTQKATKDLAAFSKSLEASFKRFEDLLAIKIEADVDDATKELSEFHNDVSAMFEEIAEGPDVDFADFEKGLNDIDKNVEEITKETSKWQKSFSPLKAAALGFADNFKKRFAPVGAALSGAFVKAKDFGKELGTRLKSSLDKAATSFKDFGSRASRGFRSLYDAIFNVKTAIVGVVGFLAARQLVSGIAAVTDAAAKQEVAVNKLNSALRLAGDFSDEASRDLQNFASDLQSVTTIGDETTLEMLALAKSFGVSNEGAKELVTAAADLAEVTGLSLDSAVKNLGKTYGGLTGELGEVIPALKELTTEQLKSGEAIGFVTQRFGGAATAATNTYSGAMKQLSNAFGDFQETLGQIITDNPVVITLIQSLKSAFEDLGAFVTANQDGVRGFINDGIRAMMDLVPHAIRILGGLGKGFISMARAILGATRNSIEFFNFLLDGSDDVSDALKLIANPINAIVLGMTAVKEVMLGEAISKQEQEAKKLNLQLFQLRKHYEEGRISQEQFHDSAREVRDRMIENNEEINKLNGELDTLQKVGELVSIEIEADTAKFQEQIKKATETAIKGEELLVKAELGLSEATEALATRLEGVAAAVKAAPNSKGTGAGGSNNVTAGPSDFQKLKDFFLGDFGKTIGTAFAQNLTKGREGGIATLGAGAGALAEAALPGAGAIVGPIVSELAGATKEEAKQMAKDFALGITEGIRALIENAPVFVEALAENSGEIITAIIAAGPKITAAFIKMQPMIAKALIQELVDGFKYQMEQLGPGFAEFGQNFKEGVVEAGEEFVDFIRYELPEAIHEGIDILVDGFHHVSQQFVDNITAIPDALGRQLPLVITKAFQDAAQVLSEGMVKFTEQAFAGGEELSRIFKEDIGGNMSKTFKDVFGKDGPLSKLSKSFDEGTKGFVKEVKTLGGNLSKVFRPFSDAVAKISAVFENFKLPNLGGGGGGKGGLLGGKVVPGFLATGGFVEGFGTKDTVPAMLTPGELVIDRTTGPRLNRFLDSAEAGGGGANAELLSRILALLERPQTVQTEVRLNERVLADIILQLNKANARLTA